MAKTPGSSQFAPILPGIPGTVTAAPEMAVQAWLDYVTDACQRSVLFLDLLRPPRQRAKRDGGAAGGYRFDYELLMSGRSLERPINFALTRIVPPPGVQIDPRQRPVVVVVDPRAGQGPGIGGFKEQSRRLRC
jgi:hypothetical protein